MNRFVLGVASIAVLVMPSWAADYQMRPAYEPDWETTEDSLRFELGLRYWYSWGRQNAGFGSTVLAATTPVSTGDGLPVIGSATA